MKTHGLAIEHWHWTRKYDVKCWLEENFGPENEQWGTQYDYGLDNLWMDEEVYFMYKLRWS